MCLPPSACVADFQCQKLLMVVCRSCDLAFLRKLDMLRTHKLSSIHSRAGHAPHPSLCISGPCLRLYSARQATKASVQWIDNSPCSVFIVARGSQSLCHNLLGGTPVSAAKPSKLHYETISSMREALVTRLYSICMHLWASAFIQLRENTMVCSGSPMYCFDSLSSVLYNSDALASCWRPALHGQEIVGPVCIECIRELSLPAPATHGLRWHEYPNARPGHEEISRISGHFRRRKLS